MKWWNEASKSIGQIEKRDRERERMRSAASPNRRLFITCIQMLFEEKSTSTNYSGRSAFFNHARSILTPLPFGSGPHHPCAASLRSDEPRRRVSQRVSRAYNTRVPPTFTSRLLLAPTQSSQPCSCSFDLTLALSLTLSLCLSLSLFAFAETVVPH